MDENIKSLAKNSGETMIVTGARFLMDEEDSEYKGFNPKKIIHAIGFMLVGISILGILYGCMKVLAFMNKQKRI